MHVQSLQRKMQFISSITSDMVDFQKSRYQEICQLVTEKYCDHRISQLLRKIVKFFNRAQGNKLLISSICSKNKRENLLIDYGEKSWNSSIGLGKKLVICWSVAGRKERNSSISYREILQDSSIVTIKYCKIHQLDMEKFVNWLWGNIAKFVDWYCEIC